MADHGKNHGKKAAKKKSPKKPKKKAAKNATKSRAKKSEKKKESKSKKNNTLGSFKPKGMRWLYRVSCEYSHSDGRHELYTGFKYGEANVACASRIDTEEYQILQFERTLVPWKDDGRLFEPVWESLLPKVAEPITSEEAALESIDDAISQPTDNEHSKANLAANNTPGLALPNEPDEVDGGPPADLVPA